MTGDELIALERQRQMVEEGWTPEHDDEHDMGELALAAVCYAAPRQVFTANSSRRFLSDSHALPDAMEFIDPWPFDRKWDKRGRGSRVRELVKAGALIAAEIDRLQRAYGKKAANNQDS